MVDCGQISGLEAKEEKKFLMKFYILSQYKFFELSNFPIKYLAITCITFRKVKVFNKYFCLLPAL